MKVSEVAQCGRRTRLTRVALHALLGARVEHGLVRFEDLLVLRVVDLNLHAVSTWDDRLGLGAPQDRPSRDDRLRGQRLARQRRDAVAVPPRSVDPSGTVGPDERHEPDLRPSHGLDGRVREVGEPEHVRAVDLVVVAHVGTLRRDDRQRVRIRRGWSQLVR